MNALRRPPRRGRNGRFRSFGSPRTRLGTKVDPFGALYARFAGFSVQLAQLSGAAAWYPYVNLDVRPESPGSPPWRRARRSGLLMAPWFPAGAPNRKD